MDINRLLIVTILLFSSLSGGGVVAWNEIQKSLTLQKKQAESRFRQTKKELTEIKVLIAGNMQKTEDYIAVTKQSQSIINTDLRNIQDSIRSSLHTTRNDVDGIKEKTDIIQISQIENRIIIEPTNRVDKLYRKSGGPKYSEPNSLKAANILNEKLKTLENQMQKLQEFERKLERYEANLDFELTQIKSSAMHLNIEEDTTLDTFATVSLEQYSKLKDKIKKQDHKIDELERQLEMQQYKLKSFDKHSASNKLKRQPKPQQESARTRHISLTQNAKKCSDNSYSRKFKCIRNLTLEYNNIGYEHKSVRLIIRTPDGKVLVNQATENDAGKAKFEISIKSKFLEKGLYDTELYGNRNNMLKDEHFSI